MVDNSQGRYLVQELDPELLSTSFKFQTSWHVITGAPCSGKTTLIDQIAGIGYLTAIETAREYFEVEMAKGRTSQEIRGSGRTLQWGIFGMQKYLENGLSPEQVMFLDRGLPDSLAFHRIWGFNPNELLLDCRIHRYTSVFILDRLPFIRDTQLGPEDEKSAQFIDDWLERDYAALGYHVVRVPVRSPEERLDFVLERITNLKQS